MGKLAATALALSCVAGPAFAQADLFSDQAISVLIDLRAATSDGETSWVDGGFGKTRFGGDHAGGFKGDAQLADAIVEWRPRLGWAFSAVVDLEIQSDQEKPVDVTEAYLQFKPLLNGRTRLSSRAGVFWAPVSMEHDGAAWTTTRTITPSAANSWISEEVKAPGIEVKVSQPIGSHELGLTGGAFKANDTAGTLLSFRGWSLNDVRAGLKNYYDLPPLSPFIAVRQAPFTTPGLELDQRTGYYVRLDWLPPAPVTFNATYYDNNGDMIGVNADKEWSWKTRFWNLGMAWKPAEDIEVLAQAMWGETLMGYPRPVLRWVETDFDTAYVLVTKTLETGAITGRLDRFTTTDRSLPAFGDTNETGWSATAAWRFDLSETRQIFLEALHVDSDRPSRALAGIAPRQTTNTFQASARFWF